MIKIDSSDLNKFSIYLSKKSDEDIKKIQKVLKNAGMNIEAGAKDNSSKLHIVSIITFSTSVRPPKPSSSTDSVISLMCLSKRIIIAYSPS